MPLIAKEVTIKIAVNDKGGKGKGAPASQNGGQTGNPDIISACVEQVLEILKEKIEP